MQAHHCLKSAVHHVDSPQEPNSGCVVCFYQIPKAMWSSALKKAWLRLRLKGDIWDFGRRLFTGDRQSSPTSGQLIGSTAFLHYRFDKLDRRLCLDCNEEYCKLANRISYGELGRDLVETGVLRKICGCAVCWLDQRDPVEVVWSCLNVTWRKLLEHRDNGAERISHVEPGMSSWRHKTFRFSGRFLRNLIVFVRTDTNVVFIDTLNFGAVISRPSVTLGQAPVPYHTQKHTLHWTHFPEHRWKVKILVF